MNLNKEINKLTYSDIQGSYLYSVNELALDYKTYLKKCKSDLDKTNLKNLYKELCRNNRKIFRNLRDKFELESEWEVEFLDNEDINKFNFCQYENLDIVKVVAYRGKYYAIYLDKTAAELYIKIDNETLDSGSFGSEYNLIDALDAYLDNKIIFD